MQGFSSIDYVALLFFVAAWFSYWVAVELTPAGKRGLNLLMNGYRHRWMEQMVVRENRIVDTTILASLQNGTAFFASTSLLAIGGVLALVLTRQTLTVASLVGFVSLGGIAVRNGILLVTHYFHLMKEEGEEFTETMILRGSLERLAPVLMTALTAGIGLLPLVVGGKKPGLEILYPVATVILGGLVTSTFCEFLLRPGLFWKFSGNDVEGLVRHDGSEADLLKNV